MYINKVVIKKFRHLENETLGPFICNKNTSELIAFAGPNGSGKSSVLELISFALSNSYSQNWSLSRTFNGFSFEVAIGLTPEEKRIVIDSLKKELEPALAGLALQEKNIDDKSGVTEAQKEQLKLHMRDQILGRVRYHDEIIKYLTSNDIYYRAFEYEAGEYHKNIALHTQIHNYVTKELKDALKRSLGFFLRADRNYPQKGFDRQKIFTFDSIKRKEHLWTIAFNTSEIQYQDMYEYLVQQRYHYLRELGLYHSKKSQGHPVDSEPTDPILPYEELLNKLFPDYKFADMNESIPSNLYINIPSGETIPFNDLSSGEKEVFFILSFFVRHNVENAIIVIDEPELHLHPELSRLLIRNMKSIRNGNQIWVATHNPEIIDEAGRDKVIYVGRDITTRKAKFVSGDTEQEAIAQLRNLFGFSGYIGIAKNFIFLEGDNSSQDRKFFSTIFLSDNSNFKLIPANSSDNLQKINSAILSIMDANLGWMNFFLIRDKDYLTPDMIQSYVKRSAGKIFVLSKHEIENYLIQFDVISIVLDEIFNIKKTPDEINQIFHQVAFQMSSDVIRDMIAFRLNLILNPQDFSIGKILNKQNYFDSTGSEANIKTEHSDLLKSKFNDTATNIHQSLTLSLSPSAIENVITECEQEVKAALATNEWLNLFPGKELIETVSKVLGISTIAFQNSIIKQLSHNREYIDSELIHIFSAINTNAV